MNDAKPPRRGGRETAPNAAASGGAPVSIEPAVLPAAPYPAPITTTEAAAPLAAPTPLGRTAPVPPSPSTIEPIEQAVAETMAEMRAESAAAESAAEPIAESAPETTTESAAGAAGESVEAFGVAGEDAWTALADLQAALAQGLEEMATAMTTITRSHIAATTAAATAMLDARSFAETFEITAGLLRRRTDAAVEASATLSEISIKTATQASLPMLARLSSRWSGAGFP